MRGTVKDGRIEIIGISGLLRVIVRPSLHWFWVLLEGVGLIVASQVIYRSWHVLGTAGRAICVFAIVSSALSLFYVQTGTEIIEFSPQGLSIIKEFRGWEYKREFRIEDCSELQLHEGSKSGRDGLECKVRWRRLTFGRNISEGEAGEILGALQRVLPAVAQKVCSFPAETKHFTTLGLS